MDLSKIKQPPPTSKAFLGKVYKNIVQPILNGRSLNFVQFRGSGKLSNIKYIFNYLSLITDSKPNHLLVMINIRDYANDVNLALKSSLSFSIMMGQRYIEKEVIDLISQAVGSEVTLDSFSKLIHKLTYDYNHKVTIILDHSEYLYNSRLSSVKSLIDLPLLFLINPAKTNILFLSKGEFDIDNLDLGVINKYFMSNILYDKDYLFDKDSVIQLFDNLGEENNFKFKKSFINKAFKISNNDPYVYKELGLKCINDSSFEKRFIEIKEIEEVYNLIGKEFLNKRFFEIIDSISLNAIQVLMGKREYKTLEEKYIYKVGLYSKEGYLNRLFEYYCISVLPNLFEGIKESREGWEDKKVLFDYKKSLTGMEFIVFEYLISKIGKIVTRDDLADVMWGDKWVEKYSDWAIDKVLSEIRKKIGNKYVLKTVRNKGYILEVVK